MRPEFTCGLLTGAAVCLWIMAEYLLGFHTTNLAAAEYADLLSLLIPLVALFLLLRHRQARAPGGRLGFWPGVLSGLSASFISGALIYLFLQVYEVFINPGWSDNVLDWQVARYRAAGLTEPAIREKIRFYRQLHSPLGCLLSLVGGTTLAGGFFSALLLLLRRRKPAPTPAHSPCP